MAQIDIKNCDVFLEDGYTGPGGIGAVNLMAGYTTGAVTMTVDGFTGAVAVGDQFTLPGDPAVGALTVHTISAHTETSGHTTSITFAPAIGVTIADNTVITMLPHASKIRVGEGNVQWTEKRPVVYVKDRGLLDTVRLGDQEPVEVKLDFTWVFLQSQQSDIVPTIEDVLKHRGPAALWVSSSADPCEPYCVDVKIVYTPPCTTPGETYLLPNFRYEDLGHDLKTGAVSCTGKCNVVAAVETRP